MKEDPIKSFHKAFKGFLKEENLEHKFRQKKITYQLGTGNGKDYSFQNREAFYQRPCALYQSHIGTIEK